MAGEEAEILDFGYWGPMGTGGKDEVGRMKEEFSVLVADGDGGVPVGVKKEMPWIFPSQAGGLRLEG